MQATQLWQAVLEDMQARLSKSAYENVLRPTRLVDFVDDVATVATGNTGSGGAASLYPQSTDVLTWAGQFDVPVRFDVDDMKKQIVDRNGPNGDLLVDWGSIPIIEIRV